MKRLLKAGSILCICMILLSGCGSNSHGENIDAAMNLIGEHKYQEAMTAFESATEQREDPQMIARGQGIASMGLTDYEGAVTYFRTALSYSGLFLDELDYDMNYYLADAYTRLGEAQRASDTYSAILALEPKEIDALFLRGKISLEAGDYNSAVADFEQALAYDSNDYDLRIEIAGLLTEAGYQAEGQKYLSDFLAENEKKLSDYDKGRIYYYLGDYENARVSLEKAKTDNSENTILILGKTYEQLGDFNYATSVYRNYLEEHAESAIIYNQLGLCKLQSEEYTEALAAFRSAAAIENNGMEQILAFNQIVANEYLGDFKQAAVLMNDYIKKYPEDTDAQREYNFLLTR